MPVKPKSPIPEFRGFVQLELTEEDVGTIQAAKAGTDVMLDTIAGIIGDGYRFSWYQEPEGFSYKATLMDVDATRASSGYMLSGSGPTALLALSVLTFKHLFKMGSRWTPFLAQTNRTHGLR